jgi:hypothetical protein
MPVRESRSGPRWLGPGSKSWLIVALILLAVQVLIVIGLSRVDTPRWHVTSLPAAVDAANRAR